MNPRSAAWNLVLVVALVLVLWGAHQRQPDPPEPGLCQELVVDPNEGGP